MVNRISFVSATGNSNESTSAVYRYVRPFKWIQTIVFLCPFCFWLIAAFRSYFTSASLHTFHSPCDPCTQFKLQSLINVGHDNRRQWWLGRAVPHNHCHQRLELYWRIHMPQTNDTIFTTRLVCRLFRNFYHLRLYFYLIWFLCEFFFSARLSPIFAASRSLIPQINLPAWRASRPLAITSK